MIWFSYACFPLRDKNSDYVVEGELISVVLIKGEANVYIFVYMDLL